MNKPGISISVLPNIVAALILMLGVLPITTAQANPTLVKDLAPTTQPVDSFPGEFVEVNGLTYFVATTPEHGIELYATDGTQTGTYLVKDIFPGSSDSRPSELTNINGTLFFRADDGVTGRELWKSDGTAAGTVPVKDIHAGLFNSTPNDLTNVNGMLFFSADDGTNGTELWKSDGTMAGTVLVKDISPGFSGSSPSFLTDVGGTLFFQARDAINGDELWKSDGTTAGTVLVKDIRVGGHSKPQQLTDVGGMLFFQADDGVNGKELWKSDGTAGGTVLVKDINSTGVGNPQGLTALGSTLFFSADDGTNGQELWKSDGSLAGTVLVKDISGSGSGNPTQLTVSGGALFFTANDATSGIELWKSDGSLAGTVLVKDILVGSNSGLSSFTSRLTDLNGTLFFRANDGTAGIELWKSDGTGTGTALVKDIFAGSDSSSPFNFIDINGTLFFTATDGVTGNEFWKSDGTTAGTELVKNIATPDVASGRPRDPVAINGITYFRAFDAVNGIELWKSDGTMAGTVLVKDIRAGSDSSSPFNFTDINGTLFFTANDGTNGTELWKSDGTTAGTVLVKDIRVGGNSSYNQLTNVNGTLFFRADDGVNGTELWKSDGTGTGTVMVKDIRVGGSSFPSELTNFNGTLFFHANDGTNGDELWKSDGTTAGTVLVQDIRVGGSSFPGNLTEVSGALFFRVNGINGPELWISDGTTTGTVLVKEIITSQDAFLDEFINVNGVLYFIMDDDVATAELWKSDGTLAGTVLVKDGFLGSSSGFTGIVLLTNVNGTLFFVADDAVNGEELWTSDGTTAGTSMVKDIRSGPGGSIPRYFTTVNGTLFFRAIDDLGGDELWQSDGTTAGTQRVAELVPGTGGSDIEDIIAVGNTLLISANDGVVGQELWKYEVPTGTGQLGDFIWDDLNGNGVQDSGEPGLDYVMINLRNCTSPNVIATTMSNSSGMYLFDQLPAGDYQMEYILLPGYHFSPRWVGHWSTDSSADPTTGLSPCITNADGQERLGLDVGMVLNNPPGTGVIGDYVWDDLNKNGIQDTNEPGLGGVLIELLDCNANNAVVTSTTSNPDGSFAFNQVGVGSFRLQLYALPGYHFTLKNQGHWASDSNANANGRTNCVSMAAGQVRNGIDAGLCIDPNANVPDIDVMPTPLDFGIVDIPSSSTLNITIANMGSADLMVSGISISGSSAFNFAFPISAGLIPPNSSDMIPVTYVPTAATTDIATIVITTNDPDEPTISVPITGQGNVLAPEINLDPALLDFGSVQTGNSVTLTTQIQNLGETALTYSLAGTCGPTSGDFGIPMASGSVPANSSVPLMVTYTPSDIGMDTGCIQITSNDPDEPIVELSFTAVGVDVPAGTGVLGDYVWEDLNGNGKQDNNEPGLANVTIELLSCDGPDTLVTSTTSNSNGGFSFNQVGVGNFKLRFTPHSGYSYSPTGRGYWANDSNAGANGKSACLSMYAGQTRNAIDGGYVPDNNGGGGGTGQYGDYVWDDLNGNSIQNNNEPGLANVSVELWTCNGSNTMVDTATTDSSGHFLFTTLGVGSYRMKYNLLPDYHFADVGLGSNYRKDSNANPSTGYTSCLYFNAGQIRKALDAGMHHN